MCVLRNLSYQLESEVDLQDGSEDVLDREWEAEQRRDLEEVTSRWVTVRRCECDCEEVNVRR